jgi:hypothetical protein
MALDAVIKFRPLRVGQRYRVRFQALPNRIQQFCFLRWGEIVYLASKIAHTHITVARFLRTSKLLRVALWCSFLRVRIPSLALFELWSRSQDGKAPVLQTGDRGFDSFRDYFSLATLESCTVHHT